MSECLRRIYRGKEFIFSGTPQNEAERFNSLPVPTREEIVLVTGHAPRLTGIDEIDSLPTITLLRHPVDRVKSFCQHVSEGKSPHLRDVFPPEKFSLNALLESGNGELSNFQAKNLLGQGTYKLPRGSEENLIEQAVHVLTEQLASFGIVERFDESLIMFHHRLHWEKWPLYRKVNQSRRQTPLEFSNRQIEQIRRLNQIDLSLYYKGIEIFNKRFEELSRDLRRHLTRFRRRQQVLALYFNTYTPFTRIRHRLSSRFAQTDYANY